MEINDARLPLELIAAGRDAQEMAKVLPWVTQVSTEEREECAQQIYSAAQSAAASGSKTQLHHVLGR